MSTSRLSSPATMYQLSIITYVHCWKTVHHFSAKVFSFPSRLILKMDKRFIKKSNARRKPVCCSILLLISCLSSFGQNNGYFSNDKMETIYLLVKFVIESSKFMKIQFSGFTTYCWHRQREQCVLRKHPHHVFQVSPSLSKRRPSSVSLIQSKFFEGELW